MFVAVLIGMMGLLFIWAATNIALWFYKKDKTNGKMHYFWQMNALWNVINLIIVLVSLVLAFIYTDGFNNNQSTQELLIWIVAFNILLDLIYVGAGLFIENKGKKSDDIKFQGWGMSVQLQGAWLFFFDTILSLSLLIVII